MPAEISVYGGVEGTWWQDGKNGGLLFNEGLWATAAGREVGIDGVTYETRPITVNLGHGKKMSFPERVCIVRSPVPHTDARTTGVYEANLDEPEPISIVSSKYHIVQPWRFLELLDSVSHPDMVKDGHAPWTVDTIGLLRGGKQFFVSLKVGHDNLFGSETEGVDWYMLCGTDWTGRAANYARMIMHQTYCANTWAANMGSANTVAKISIPHRADAEDKIKLAIELHRIAAYQQEGMRALMHFMGQVRITDEAAKDVVRAMYPMSKEAEALWDKGIGAGEEANRILAERLSNATRAKVLEDVRNAERRAFAQALWDKYQDTRYGGDSAYNFFGAMVDAAQHREGRGDMVYATLYGERQKEMNRAWKALTGVMKTARDTENQPVAVNIPWLKK